MGRHRVGNGTARRKNPDGPKPFQNVILLESSPEHSDNMGRCCREAEPEGVPRVTAKGEGIPVMKRILGTTALALILASTAACTPAEEQAAEDNMEAAGESMENAGENMEEAAEDAGENMEEAASDAGESMENMAHEAGEALEDMAHEAGEAMEDAGEAIQEATDDDGEPADDDTPE